MACEGNRTGGQVSTREQERFEGFVTGQDDEGIREERSAAGLPDKIKVDLDTPLESALLGMAIIGAVGLVIAGFASMEGGVPSLVWQALVGLTGIGAIGYRGTNNYYVVDTRRKMLTYHFQFFSYRSEKPVAPFAQVVVCTVNGIRQSSKHSTWWEYAPFVVLKSGEKIKVGDYKREYEGFTTANSVARKLANVTGARFLEGKTHHQMKVKRNSFGTVEVTLEQYHFPFLWVAAIIGAMVFLPFIIGFLSSIFGR